MSSIFGGSKQKQRSENQSSATSSASNLAFGGVNSSFSPLYEMAQWGSNGIRDLLGGDTSGFDKYKAATGFDLAAKTGGNSIIGDAAAKGMLRSGAAAKAITRFGNDIQNQYANDYINKLIGVSDMGYKAANAVTGAGGVSSSSSQSRGFSSGSGSSKPGLGGFLGQIGAGIAASDRRLKERVYKIGELKNGLNLYQYHYINGSGPHIGVMADEVEAIQPEALGPVIDGYATVNYDLIEKEVV